VTALRAGNVTAARTLRGSILDSWARPKYARLDGRKAADRTIQRRFRPYADLAFWLYLFRDWVEDGFEPALGCSRSGMGPVAQPVFKTGEAWQPHAG
jgi:hypothetical protein